VRKNAMLKRGIAGSRRKKWHAAMVLETKKLFLFKSKLLHVVSPKLRAPTHFHSDN
jgi:hypothetical protein